MTREEAINLLGWLKSKTNRDDDLEAIDMAIEALSAESVHGDMISRADAMGAVQDHFNADGFKGYDDGQKMMDRIKALPSPCKTCGYYNLECPKDCEYGRLSAEAKGDLISRELAMERIANDNVSGGMDRINEYNNSTEFNEYLDGISDAITTIFCDVPSADITETEACQKCQDVTEKVLNRQGDEIKRLKASAEAVQGEWIDIDNYYRLATCSHCHKVTMFEKWGEYTKPYNFCPNCGAIMYKGGDSE